MKRVLGNTLCDLDPKVKVKGKRRVFAMKCTIDCCWTSVLYRLRERVNLNFPLPLHTHTHQSKPFS